MKRTHTATTSVATAKVATTAVVTAAILCALTLSGCDDSPSVAGPEQLNTAGFPLAVGNWWEYAVTSQVVVDTLGAGTGTTNIEARVTWLVEELDSVLGEEAYRLASTFNYLAGPDSGSTRTVYTWFRVKDDTLKAHASGDISGLSLPEAQLHRPATSRSSADTLATTMHDWNTNVLVYPLSVGASWTYANWMTQLGHKVVEAKEGVTVPALSADAYLVVRGHTGEDATWSVRQWFSSIGIVKMEYSFDGPNIDRHGVTDAMVTTTMTMKLLSYDLN
jgi:hypothetical protein